MLYLTDDDDPATAYTKLLVLAELMESQTVKNAGVEAGVETTR